MDHLFKKEVFSCWVTSLIEQVTLLKIHRIIIDFQAKAQAQLQYYYNYER